MRIADSWVVDTRCSKRFWARSQVDLVRDEAPLKGGHAVPAEDGAVAPGPEPPQEVHAELPLRGTGLVVIGPAGGLLGVVQKRPAGSAPFRRWRRSEQLAVLRHGDAAVEEQVAVEHLIQPALGVEEADVPLQLFAALEGGGELVDDLAPPPLSGRRGRLGPQWGSRSPPGDMSTSTDASRSCRHSRSYPAAAGRPCRTLGSACSFCPSSLKRMTVMALCIRAESSLSFSVYWSASASVSLTANRWVSQSL